MILSEVLVARVFPGGLLVSSSFPAHPYNG